MNANRLYCKVVTDLHQRLHPSTQGQAFIISLHAMFHKVTYRICSFHLNFDLCVSFPSCCSNSNFSSCSLFLFIFVSFSTGWRQGGSVFLQDLGREMISESIDTPSPELLLVLLIPVSGISSLVPTPLTQHTHTHTHKHTCTHTCKQLPSNQSFDKQISSHQKGGGVSRWGEWVGKATAYKFDTCTHTHTHTHTHSHGILATGFLFAVTIIMGLLRVKIRVDSTVEDSRSSLLGGTCNCQQQVYTNTHTTQDLHT